MAAALKAEGIILRKYFLRETSYILVILTKEFGKIRGVIKGVRNPYPKFAGDFEIFTNCELLFYKKKKSLLDLITQCDALEFFLPVRKDIERLTYANYFIELIDIVTNDYDDNKQLYDILIESLRMLASGASARRTSRIFELNALDALGLSPEFERCVECGSADNDRNFFSVKAGGVLCLKCRNLDGSAFNISLGTIKFMRKIQTSDLKRTSSIKVSKEVGIETEKVLKRFMQYYISRPIKSLKFLGQLERSGIV